MFIRHLLSRKSFSKKLPRNVVISCLSLSAFAVFGSEPKINEPLMDPKLMEQLSGTPAINYGSDAELTQLPIADATMIKGGAKLYLQHCAACHGEKLQGQPNPDVRLDSGLLPAPAHDESGHTWHHADDQLFEIVKYGPAVAMRDPDYLSSMPSFQATLDDTAIVSILVFIRSTWPAHLQEWQNGANDAQTGKRWWLEEEVVEEIE